MLTRKLSGGMPQDTSDNAADFLLVATEPATITSASAVLGAPGPENTSSPIQANATISLTQIDPTQPATAAPNRVRDTRTFTYTRTSTTGGTIVFPNGTLSIQRRLTNNTGGPVRRLRFRIVDLTTLNSPSVCGGCTQADLRVLSSTGTVVNSNGDVAATVSGLRLEEPPNQDVGGGSNGTLLVDLSSLPGGALAAGSSIDVQFLLGVAAGGQYRFAVNIEVLP
jgi:hypothetical protein